MGDNSDVENFDDVLTVHLDGPGFQNNPPPPSPSIENVSRSKQQTPPKKTTPIRISRKKGNAGKSRRRTRKRKSKRRGTRTSKSKRRRTRKRKSKTRK